MCTYVYVCIYICICIHTYRDLDTFIHRYSQMDVGDGEVRHAVELDDLDR